MKDIASHILDLTENSIRAKASKIMVTLDFKHNIHGVLLHITDNGCGMNQQQLNEIFDPFFTSRTTRQVGLGLPLAKMNAERSGGHIKIDSCLGKGTFVEVLFCNNNIDSLPLGDIAGILTFFLTSNSSLDVRFVVKNLYNEFSLSTHELIEVFGEQRMNQTSNIKKIKELINNNLEQIMEVSKWQKLPQ